MVQAIEGGGGGQTQIRFRTCNIQNGWNGGLKLELRGMGQLNVYVGVFQEAKLTDSIYTRGSAGYRVVVTPAPIRHRSSIAIFYLDPPSFAVEVIRQFNANFTMCQLETGDKRWYIVRCYLMSGHGAMIQEVEAAMAERPRGTEMIVVGEFKLDLERTGRWGRDKEIAMTVETSDMEDILVKFLP